MPLNRLNNCPEEASTTETLIGTYFSEGETTFIYEAESLPQDTTAITNSELPLQLGADPVGTLGTNVATCIDAGGSVRIEIQGSTEAGNFTQDFSADAYTLQDGINFAGDLILQLTGTLPNFTFGFGQTFTFQLSLFCVSSGGSEECFAYGGVADPLCVTEPDCDDWKTGFKCSTVSLLAKLNWILNQLTCIIISFEQRLNVLDNQRLLVDVTIVDGTATELFSDGSTEVTDLSSYQNVNVDTDQVVFGFTDPNTGIMTLENEDGSLINIPIPALQNSNSSLVSWILTLVRNPNLPAPVMQAGVTGHQLIVHAPTTVTFPANLIGQQVLVQGNWSGIPQGTVDEVDLRVRLQCFSVEFNRWDNVAFFDRRFDTSNNSLTTEITYELPPASITIPASGSVQMRFSGLSRNYTTGGKGVFFSKAEIKTTVFIP